MSVTVIPTPAGVSWIELRCRLGVLVADGADADRYPDAHAVTGKVRLTVNTPSNRIKWQEADGGWRSLDLPGIEYDVNAEGRLVSPDGAVGVFVPDPLSTNLDPREYTITALVRPEGGAPWTVTIGGTLAMTSPVDLVHYSTVTPSPGVPSLEARVAALEAGAGTGSGSLVQIGVLALPGSPREGEAVSVLATPSTVFPAGVLWDEGGAPSVTGRLLVTLVWTGSQWLGTYSPPFAAVDTTPPLAGALAASAISDVGFTLTVTGASDNTALHALPYQFSTDDGSSWSAWQASPIFNVTGKTASTAYQARHATRDQGGNRTLGTAIAVTTTGPIIKLADLIAEDTPSAWWQMDDETGTTMTDSSGNGRHGTYATIMNLGTPSLDPNGLRAVTQAANGTDYTAVPAGAWMDGDFTITALIRLSTITGSFSIFGRSRANGSAKWWMEVYNGSLYLNNGTTYLPESAEVAAGVTYHVAASRQGDTYRLHLDGVQISSAANAGTLTDPFDIGTRISVMHNSLRGTIDEVAWFPTALSTARIRAHAVAAGRP